MFRFHACYVVVISETHLATIFEQLRLSSAETFAEERLSSCEASSLAKKVLKDLYKEKLFRNVLELSGNICGGEESSRETSSL